MILSTKFLRSGLIAAGVVLGVAGAASASPWWDHHHPRRTEVDDRLAHQYHRINHEWREGEITRGEARNLHRRDRFVRHEEFEASLHNGHITRAEQRGLNQQENGISREIGR